MLSLGLQPLTTGSVMKISFIFSPVPSLYFSILEIIWVVSTKQTIQALQFLEWFRYNNSVFAFI